MSKFFIGQLVKVKYVTNPENSPLVGAEGRVSQIKSDGLGDLYGLDIKPLTLVLWCGHEVLRGFDEDQLSPITPEGSQPRVSSFQELMEHLGCEVAA